MRACYCCATMSAATSSASYKRGRKIVLVMVGLPARGKSYTARHLARYLSWLGYPTKVFNTGEIRRSQLGARQTHEFFDPANIEGLRYRRDLAQQTLDALISWLHEDGRVGIYDATNGTRTRRTEVRERCAREGFAVQFVELDTEDPAVIDRNVRDTKLNSPDYAGMEEGQAVRDFRRRIEHYRSTYEKVADDEGSFVRIVDRGRKVVLHEIDGYLPGRIVFFLSNLQISNRPILLTRHGESMDNVAGRIGGDSDLSPRGREYARALAAYVDSRDDLRDSVDVWTSTLRRTLQTAAPLNREISQWRYLDEIDAGSCDGMTYEEIRRKLPEEYEARRKDKLRYKYPRGESYQDVIQRLDRVIVELERYRSPVLVIGHQAVLRTLYSYFMDIPLQRCPHVEMPLHTIIELQPHAYACVERQIQLT